MAQYEFKSTFKMGTRHPEITTVVDADTYFEAVRKMDESNGFATVVLSATRDGRSLTIDHDTADQRRDRIDALPDLAPSAPAASVLGRIDKLSVEHYEVAIALDRIEAKVDKLAGATAETVDRDTRATINNLKGQIAHLNHGVIYTLEGDRNELRTMLRRLVSILVEFRTGEESKAVNDANALLTRLTSKEKT